MLPLWINICYETPSKNNFGPESLMSRLSGPKILSGIRYLIQPLRG